MKQILLLILVCLAELQAQQRRIVPLGSSGRRYALIIGNDDYKPLQKLTNAVNDANAMTRTLREANFEVTEITNGTREQMDQGVNDFIGKLPRRRHRAFLLLRSRDADQRRELSGAG